MWSARLIGKYSTTFRESAQYLLRDARNMTKKKVRLEVKRVDHQYYGLYAGDHLLIESPKRKTLEEMKKDEFKEDVASNR